MKRSDRERLQRPRPRDVDGFADAYADGLLPIVTRHPPAPGSGVVVPSAASLFWTWLAKFVATFASFFVFAQLEPPQTVIPQFLYYSAGALVGVSILWLAFRTLLRYVDRSIDEMLHGYTTVTLIAGGVGRSEHSWGEVGPPWNYDGVWVLNRKFAVKSTPNPLADPPGYYPSPNRPGCWELWTGEVWSGAYRDEPWPVAAQRAASLAQGQTTR